MLRFSSSFWALLEKALPWLHGGRGKEGGWQAQPWGQPAAPGSCWKGGSGQDPQTLSPVTPPDRRSPWVTVCVHPALRPGWVVTLDIPSPRPVV